MSNTIVRSLAHVGGRVNEKLSVTFEHHKHRKTLHVTPFNLYLLMLMNVHIYVLIFASMCVCVRIVFSLSLSCRSRKKSERERERWTDYSSRFISRTFLQRRTGSWLVIRASSRVSGAPRLAYRFQEWTCINSYETHYDPTGHSSTRS